MRGRRRRGRDEDSLRSSIVVAVIVDTGQLRLLCSLHHKPQAPAR